MYFEIFVTSGCNKHSFNPETNRFNLNPLTLFPEGCSSQTYSNLNKSKTLTCTNSKRKKKSYGKRIIQGSKMSLVPTFKVEIQTDWSNDSIGKVDV